MINFGNSENLEIQNDHEIRPITYNPTKLHYQADFPIMCFVKQNNENKEMIINHLSDANEPTRTFKFNDLEFKFFVGTNRWSVASNIAFIAQHKIVNETCLVIMNHENSFEKTNNNALNKWSILKFSLDNPVLKKNINRIVAAQLIEADS